MSAMPSDRSEYTRTVITLRKGTLQRLKEIAAERHVSMASLIRQQLDQVVQQQQPFPKAIGIIDSGRSDLSELASDVRVEPRSWR
jgi:predicted DNA-binding ribbon-helix-helix protein